MNERSSTAYRAAVLLTIFAVACNDGPLAPRHEPSQPAGMTPIEAGVQVFVGRRADSVIQAFDAVWARGSHPNYREARHAWRKANGIPDSVGDPRFTPVPFTPNAIVGIDDGSTRPLPQILSHYEALHFGRADQYTTVPDGLETDVTFIADQAEVSAVLSITKKDGAPFSFSGPVTRGPGAIINCADVTLGNCGNQRRLNSVMTLGGAPTCDASGSGSVNYSVSSVNQSFGIGSSGSNTTSVTATGAVSGTASACPTKPNDPTTKPTDPTDPPTDTPAGSPPPPTPPTPPTDPLPPSQAGTVTYFHCEEADLYQGLVLIESVITCTPY